MDQTVNWNLRVLACVLCLSLAACANQSEGSTKQQGRQAVDQSLQSMGQGLRAGTWSKVEQYFSPDYQQGYGELRDRLEQRFRDERITDLQFTVNRVLESDGLVNAQVRWRKTWVDKNGKPGKSQGVSEFILKPQNGTYVIVSIGGDRLF